MKSVSAPYLIAGVCGVGFFVLSVGLLGVWPGRVLERETKASSPAHPLQMTLSEQRGRELYASLGCAYCHTQQVRSLDADTARFGKATKVWETQFDYPHLWGTRRVGPDLSREATLHPEDWQLTHLYEPRAIVPDSVMPAFPTLFDGAPERPRQEARDLVAYLASLGHPRNLVEPVTASGQKSGPGQNGDEAYAHNCAGCHGEHGEGDGPGAAGLSPKPANLTAHEYTEARVIAALEHGVRGSSMAAWGGVSHRDLARAVRAFYRPARDPEPPANIDELGRKVYGEHCAQCHGENGDGAGSAAGELRMNPTDFTAERPTAAESLRALREGVPGTPMAPWNTKLTEAELSAVAYFVRGFYR